jgi:hypothetical protein
MNPQTNLEPARPSWRFAAGIINLIAVGFMAMIAQQAATPLGESRIRMLVLVGVTVFWLVCVLRKKSLGAVFCLLEVKRADSSVLSIPVYFLWTLPFYLFALVGYFPLSVLPDGVAMMQPILLLLLTTALVVDALFLLVTRRSLSDRWLKIAVLRLNLPDHLRPRILGIRIS